MSKAFDGTINFQAERRLCEVHGELCYFHMWYKIEPKHPDPELTFNDYLVGLIEFPSTEKSQMMQLVPYFEINFIDEEQGFLVKENEYRKDFSLGRYGLFRDCTITR